VSCESHPRSSSIPRSLRFAVACLDLRAVESDGANP
jgi:hypothetical protein